jgi:hypothetical protein
MVLSYYGGSGPLSAAAPDEWLLILLKSWTLLDTEVFTNTLRTWFRTVFDEIVRL